MSIQLMRRALHNQRRWRRPGKWGRWSMLRNVELLPAWEREDWIGE